MTDPSRSNLIGYARVAADVDTLPLQLQALEQTGCQRIYRDVSSDSIMNRPQLDACLEYLRAGDTLVIWRLDRLGRGFRHLIDTIEQLHAQQIGFRSLTEPIDTTTPVGREQLHVLHALADFQRELNRERTSAGLVAARARGRQGGRPTLATTEKLAAARSMIAEQQHSVSEIAAALGVGRTTLYRHLAGRQQQHAAARDAK
jgi:DNA invertase Pin-like site-specific DNA recombinase